MVDKKETKNVGKKTKKSVHKKKINKKAELKKVKAVIRGKSKHWFKGRFGQRPLRRPSIGKWQKWRFPHSIDANFKKEDGPTPSTGWRTPKSIRFRHPSGFYEVIVNNIQQVEQSVKEKHTAVRIGANVGKRKRIQIIEKANELGVKVLN
ncbi:MAG: eL32 family ribosomal protein [Candidatus Diapherotrites archaeon]|nr:eL32 family ribosomal protein [Candidatus Diapherotrites archaeon]